MIKNILFYFLFIPLSVFCQKGDSLAYRKDTAKHSKFEIGISYSPDFCYRSLKAKDEGKWIADTRDTLEVPKFGYTTGIFINYKFRKNMNVESGIFFSDKGEKTRKQTLENTPSGEQPIKYSLINHYYYLDIPVKFDYYLSTGKLKLYIDAGLSANIFLNQKTTIIETSSNTNRKTSSFSNPNFNRINFAFQFGCGITYPISDKMNIKIEPVYRRSITSVINAPIKSYLYEVGINIGISHTL